MGNGVLRREEHRGDVDLEVAAPLLLRVLDRAAHLDDADVVDEDIDAAVALDGEIDERLDVAGLRYVGRHDGALAALAADDLRRLLGRGKADVAAGHAGALAGEQDGYRLAIAPARSCRPAACDDCDLPLEPARHLALPFSSSPEP